MTECYIRDRSSRPRCPRCGWQFWIFRRIHWTRFGPTKGVMALCQPCWRTLLPHERLPYYQRTFQLWRETWEEGERLLAAVAAAASRPGRTLTVEHEDLEETIRLATEAVLRGE